MYGDCQVMPSSSSMLLIGGGVGGPSTGGVGGGVGVVGGGGGGGGIGGVGNMMMLSSSTAVDPLFSSPIGNPNSHHHNLSSFMASLPPFHAFSSVIPKEEAGGMGMAMAMGKDGDMESGGSGSGHVEGASYREEPDNELLFVHNQQLHQQPNQQQQQTTTTNTTNQQQQAKKKRYHRHTVRQIQEMEALFKECPHPDDKQRMKLSQDLGLKPRQVKFWFQNRRTQMKAQQDRSDNVILRAENENLKSDNFRLQAAIRNVICPSCGGPAVLGEMSFDEQHLRLENARLKEELDRLSCIVSRYGHRPLQSLGPAGLLLPPSLDLDMGIYARHFSDPGMVSCGDVMSVTPSPPPPLPAMPGSGHHPLFPTGGFVIMDQDKPLALELAMTAADQLVKMCHANEPLWVRGGGGSSREVLDLGEYEKAFPWPVDLKQHQHGGVEFRTEATRDSALVIMNSITLVDAFLDVNKWIDLFPSIVSSAKTIQVITPGISGHGNGSLHLIYAEFQFLSPLVPMREAYFLRYSQQNVEGGTWTIVDFPVDGFQEGLQVPFPRYRKRPSGCVIQDMPNGYSRVTWVEHVEVEDKPVHQIFNQFVSSGMAFGSQRWLAVLQRQCERLASLMARNISDLGVIPSPEARKNMMKLSQRMVRTFCANISSSAMHSWTALSDSSEDTIRITTRKNMEPGQPNGVILSAVSTTWLPFSHEQVFELLTDEQRRSQLDVLSSGNSLHEVAHIANGSHHRNCVSLLRINASSNSSQNVELMLQESSTHPTGGSLVVYATVDVNSVQLAMSGDDPSCIPLLPMGFVVLPAPVPPGRNDTGDDAPDNEGAGSAASSGCLLTVGLQVVASGVPSAKLNLSSVNAINNHLCNAVHQISLVLGGAGTRSEPEAAAASISDKQ